ncbi:MAG: sodium:alanine symporter family protein [Spirochaetaceae bacterium]|jgi:AGCS family alanine or glycine:cation symporter|nr:sodium:alanine symporter family protein [Spirochaetaceae bacterium]
MEQFEKIVGMIDGWLWGPWLLVLLFGTHLFITVRSGFIQRKLGLAIKLSVTRDDQGSGDVSQFGALTTALASTIGTGNIVGVGTAIALGGPGAVLWMWLTGIFGIATKYAETLISVKYRVKDEKGAMLGGAWFALERGLKMKWLGVLFALFTAIAAFGIGNMTQGNAVAKLFNQEFNVPMWVSGLVLAVLVGVVILGGIKVITRVCEKLVPFMSALYVLGCIIILIINRAYLGQAIVLIVSAAFTPKALGGGFVAYAIMEAARRGISRGLFSNEAGMGSAPIVAAAAQTRNPARQALVSSTGVFWDTVVICLMTGLVVVSSILVPHNNIGATTDGSVLVHASFNQIPFIGSIVLTFGLFTFAFSTILGWSYMGEQGAEYLLGVKSNMPYRALYTLIVLVGAIVPLELAWNIADSLNALMIIPNLIAVLLLSGTIAKDTKFWVYGNRIDETDTTPIPLRTEL